MLTNEWTPPTPPLFAAASEDDKMWFSPATVEQVASMLLAPQRWISELNGMRESGQPDITIHPTFLLSLRLAPKNPPQGAMLGKPLVVQGISGTNFLCIRPAEALHPFIDEEDWEAYWAYWQDHEPLLVMVNLDTNTGCGHLELTKSTDSREVRADKIAAFLTWGASPAKTYRPSPSSPLIPYINKIVLKVPSMFTLVEEGSDPVPVTPTTAVFEEVSAGDLSGIDFDLTGVFDDSTSATACENMIGQWGGARITLQDVVVKAY